jgi:ParB-like chromosome segregation protein Spo0J
VRAAHVLGLDEVPCIVLAHLTPAQRRAYVLADNKLALNAGWDLEMPAACALRLSRRPQLLTGSALVSLL